MFFFSIIISLWYITSKNWGLAGSVEGGVAQFCIVSLIRTRGAWVTRHPTTYVRSACARGARPRGIKGEKERWRRVRWKEISHVYNARVKKYDLESFVTFLYVVAHVIAWFSSGEVREQNCAKWQVIQPDGKKKQYCKKNNVSPLLLYYTILRILWKNSL